MLCDALCLPALYPFTPIQILRGMLTSGKTLSGSKDDVDEEEQQQQEEGGKEKLHFLTLCQLYVMLFLVMDEASRRRRT